MAGDKGGVYVGPRSSPSCVLKDNQIEFCRLEFELVF